MTNSTQKAKKQQLPLAQKDDRNTGSEQNVIHYKRSGSACKAGYLFANIKKKQNLFALSYHKYYPQKYTVSVHHRMLMKKDAVCVLFLLFYAKYKRGFPENTLTKHNTQIEESRKIGSVIYFLLKKEGEKGGPFGKHIRTMPYIGSSPPTPPYPPPNTPPSQYPAPRIQQTTNWCYFYYFS